MLALMTALHGDIEASRSLLDKLEVDAEDDPYAITVWAAFSVVTAAVGGDPAWASRAANRGIAVDPDHSFVFLGGYQRLARCWARAVSGEDPADAAAEAEGRRCCGRRGTNCGSTCHRGTRTGAVCR